MVAFSAVLPNFTGQTITSSRFQLRLVRQIGCGAYGTVYLAKNLAPSPSSPSQLAVKCMLQPELGSDLETVQEREITFLKHMSSHPYITTLYEVIKDKHYVYLVMDYYEGGDLFSAIVDRKTFYRRDDNVKRGFIQLLDAVEACHKAGIYHRDLKPENILCSHGDTRLYLSDFGLATQSAASTSFGCGSVYYMSPECIGDSKSRKGTYPTQTSDVWSLGVILVNMLTGRNPWRIASAIEDEGYAQYLRDGARFLPWILPISGEAAHVLSLVFNPKPRLRITISELRHIILKVHSFFPAVDSVPDYVRYAEMTDKAAARDKPRRRSDGVVRVTFEKPKPRATRTPPATTPNVEITESSFVNGRSSATSSETESPGPATPEMHPAAPVTIVPPLSLAAGSGVAGMVDVRRSGLQAPQPAKVHNKIPRKVQRFVGAIHRIF